MAGRPYVVDGHNLAMRSVMQAALDDLQAGGTYTGGLYGALRSLRRIIGFPGFRCSRVIVCFDAGKPEWRRELVPEYKAARAEKRSKIPPDELKRMFAQVDLFRIAVAYLGATVVWFNNREADDGVAAVCRCLADERPVVVSGDKDLLQLVDDRVTVWMLRKGADLMVNRDTFADVSPVPVGAYLAYRTLTGDPSDGIPGIAGLGEKRATEVVRAVIAQCPDFVTLSGAEQAAAMVVYAHALLAGPKPPKWAHNLAEGAEALQRYVQVMDLSDSWGDDTGLRALLQAEHPIQKGAFLAMCRTYRFASIVQELGDFLRPFTCERVQQ
jgi:5'-3' exonuclease